MKAASIFISTSMEQSATGTFYVYLQLCKPKADICWKLMASEYLGRQEWWKGWALQIFHLQPSTKSCLARGVYAATRPCMRRPGSCFIVTVILILPCSHQIEHSSSTEGICLWAFVDLGRWYPKTQTPSIQGLATKLCGHATTPTLDPGPSPQWHRLLKRTLPSPSQPP